MTEKWGEKYARKADAFAATEHWKEEAKAALFLTYGWFGTIVDLGCNTGRLIELARKNGHENTFVGVDVNEAALPIAEERLPDVQFYHSIASLPRESVDAVLCMHTINQIEDRETVIRDVWNTLDRRGLFVVVTHNPRHQWKYWLRNRFNGYRPDETISWEPTLGELKQEMYEHGFRTTHAVYFGPEKVPLLRRRLIWAGMKA